MTQFLHQGMTTETVTRESTPVPTFAKQDDFSLPDRNYSHQFFSMYQYRLSALKQRVDTNASYKWDHKKVDGQAIVHKEKILDIQTGELCWVSGTVFCDMSNKLNILKDVEQGTDDVLPKPPSTYTGNAAVVMIEDESGRAILRNDAFLKENVLVTGCIIAVLGVEVEAGIFEIMDVVYPLASPQKEITGKSQGKVAFVSGLNIVSSVDYDLKIELLKQYLGGEIGGDSDKTSSSSISQLVVVGNSTAAVEQEVDEDYVTSNNYGLKNTATFTLDSVLVLSSFVSDTVASLPVTVMPGSSDPAEISLPQQKLHPSFFGVSRKYLGANFTTATNPAWLELPNGVRMLGSSGQNIDDIYKYLSEEKDVVSLLEANLKWQNIIPTAPDTLYCYPFEDFDPFLFRDETPHVYFVGNQTYASEMVHIRKDHQTEETIAVRVVAVPKFAETGEIVVMDMETLETEVVQFDV